MAAKKSAKQAAKKGGALRAKAPAKAPAKSPAKASAQLPARSPAKNPAKKPAVRKAPQSMPYELGKWAHVFAPRAPGERRYWLLKSEPDVFSFADLQSAPKQTTCWDSVRNTAARNFMRDGMRRGDLAFYYHSNAEPSAIVGICEVVREGYPDHTAFDSSHPYFDADSVRDTPTWFMVDVRAVEALARPVSLPEIKESTALAEMALIKVGRLSVVPVTAAEWKIVLEMSRR
jgi:predicted RNA-binding protein with PUA-like domain